jgi:hypothetical protein
MDGAAHMGIRDLLDHNPVGGGIRSVIKRPWTSMERAIVREHYPLGGVAACLPLLPGRTASSIYQRALIDGVRSPKGTPVSQRQQWTSTPQIDFIITRVYQRTPSKGDIKQLAGTLNRPMWWVSKRATKLGLARQRWREPKWTEAEEEFAAANAHKPPENVAQMMRRRGWARTATAVSVKQKRLGTPTGRNADLDHYTANQLSILFGVDRNGIRKWIAKGWLKAERRGTDRTEAQGGDEYKIHRKEVRKLVVENVAAIDIRKVEKFWFVDLLASA